MNFLKIRNEKTKKCYFPKKLEFCLFLKIFFAAEIGRKNAEHTIPKFHFCPKIQFDFYQSNFDGKIQIENFMNLLKLIFGQKLTILDSVQGKSRAI